MNLSPSISTREPTVSPETRWSGGIHQLDGHIQRLQALLGADLQSALAAIWGC